MVQTFILSERLSVRPVKVYKIYKRSKSIYNTFVKYARTRAEFPPRAKRNTINSSATAELARDADVGAHSISL